jgi:UDP-N-acetylmuramate--alanine ligase
MRHKIDLNNAKYIHFIGIGGSSMSGLAEILLKDGYIISGSDNKNSEATARLARLGINIYIPNAGENIQASHDLIVYTAAIRPDNSEFIASKESGKQMLERSHLLKAITKGYQQAVCIAGSHGKTTTTALIAGVAVAGGLDPTVHLGGFLHNGLNNRVGSSPCFILESCEYRNTFLQLDPYIGTILNIDADHIDFYGGMDGLIGSFASFARNIRPQGALVINTATQGFAEIVKNLPCQVITFGMEANAHYYPANIQFDKQARPTFDVRKCDKMLIRVELPLPGTYNILNALACFAVAQMLEIPPEIIKHGLENAQGVKRRFEYKGNFRGLCPSSHRNKGKLGSRCNSGNLQEDYLCLPIAYVFAYSKPA